MDQAPSTPDVPLRRALVLDDSAAICSLLKLVIERRGYQVHSFEDPASALRHLEADSRRITLALVDMLMPGMTGVEFAERLHAMQPGTAVVLSSGRGLEEEQADWLQQHGALFLPKPFNLARLDALLTEAEKRVA